MVISHWPDPFGKPIRKLMKKKLNIKKRMMLFILGIAVVSYIGTFGYMTISLHQKVESEAYKLSDTFALQKAGEIKSIINEDMAVARVAANALKAIVGYPRPIRDKIREELMVNILKTYPKYDAVWMSWEISAIDSSYTKPYGRERINFYTRDGKVQSSGELANLNGDPPNSIYAIQKKEKEELLTDPYWYADYDYEKATGDSLLGISPSAPILVNGKFAGLIGTDMSVEDYQSMSHVNFMNNSHAFLLTNNGTIIAHNDLSLFGKPMDSLSFFKNLDDSFNSKLLISESFSLKVFDPSIKEDVYVAFAPIQIGRTSNHWLVGVVMPVSEISRPFYSTFVISFIVAIVGLLMLTLVTWMITNKMTKSLDDSNALLKSLAKGDLQTDKKLVIEGNDELSEIRQSVNELMEELIKKAEFANEIGKGNMDSSFVLAGKNDILGVSLINMQDNLKSVLSETNEVIRQAGNEGNLSARIDANKKSGIWNELCRSINHLIESISTPMVEVNHIAQDMANGVLSKRLGTNAKGDLLSLANNLNTALDNLSLLINDIKASTNTIDEANTEILIASNEMNSSTSEIASSIGEISQGAQRQVSKVDESSQLIEEVLSSTMVMGEKAEAINSAAKKVNENSTHGLKVINQIEVGIREITGIASKTNTSVEVLTQRSVQINRVVGIINEIASQTNLLALNAAIEAAQAGDAGRGFAVVAEEIRKLAESSRKSTKEIEKLIADIQSDTKTTAQLINDMTVSIGGSEKASIEASTAFKEITNSAGQNLDLSIIIVDSVKQQIANIRTVVSNTESIVVVAEQTAAGTEEAAASASELASGMTNLTKRLDKINDIASDLATKAAKFTLKD
jgi:methyl-accepting chemotaxis protein